MKLFLSLTLPALCLLSFNAHALVDYSETDSNPKGMPNQMAAKMPSAPRSESKSLIWKSDFLVATNYESMEIDAEKIGVLNLNTHLQTPFNIYLDLTYWQAQARAGSQSGNPKAIIGFNWLRFGTPADEAKFDFYGGGRFSGSSDLASSRSDKIFGAETTKRFGTFGLGLGYDISMTGAPKKQADMGIGNIHRIVVSGGWMVSNDIQFEVELENFKVSESNDKSRTNILIKSVSFSTLSPKLNLTLVPAVNLELGARFKTNKAKLDQNLAPAKLFDLHGAYSNSLFAGLNISL